jgi:hypothetical protein
MENSINFRRQILEALLRTRMFPKPELCRSTCHIQDVNQDDVDIEVGEVYRSVNYSKIEWEPEELEIEKLDV